MIEDRSLNTKSNQENLSEMESYYRDMEKEKEGFDFIKVEFVVEMRAAEVKYKEERKIDKDLVKSCNLSFNQWLDIKKFEAAKFYTKHSDFYI